MRIKLAVFSLAVVCSLLSFSSDYTFAQNKFDTSNITVRPFLQEIKLEPGEVAKQFDLTINNDSKFKQIFSLSAVNFGSLNETGGLAFEGASVKKISSKYGLSQWLKLERSSIELEAGQQSVVKVIINNDAQMSPGAHYAAIITTAQKPIQAVDQLTITPKVSSLIFVTKRGGEFYNIHLSSVDHNGSLWNMPTAVNLRIKSTGNTYIVPRGIVYLKQGARIISRGVINNQSAIVLPETTRNFDVPLNRLKDIKKGGVFTNYEIQVDYRYDGVTYFASKTFSYRIINKLAAAVLILILCGFMILVILFRSRILKQLHRLVKMKRRS